MYLSFYCNVCVWEEVGDQAELQYMDPHSYGHQRCVFLVLYMPNRRPRGPLCWLSQLHLISNFPGPQLSYFLSWPSYILVQRPLNRPQNLWIGTFDCHQADITLMQFRSHSLPVNQSISVSWAFILSHLISQIRLFRLLAIAMCHFLPVPHFGMACLPGSKVNI